jgi:ParB/RepB/Spo0J family partition protein
MSELMTLPIDSIHQSKHQLREVDTESLAFKEITDSVRNMGILNPIVVRREANPETGADQYVLIDGAHRLAAAKAAGLSEIPTHIANLTELDSLFAQFVGNAMRVETKMYQYSRQLLRILAIEPAMTRVELARKVGRPESFINKLLSLENINPKLGELIDNNTIELMRAATLAKLPIDEQIDWLEKAVTANSTAEFVDTVNTEIRLKKKALRDGTTLENTEFEAVPRLRKSADIKAVLADDEALKAITSGCKGASEAGRAALNWALQLDPTSVKESEEKFRTSMQAKADRRERDRSQSKEKMLAKKLAEVEKLKAEMSAAN